MTLLEIKRVSVEYSRKTRRIPAVRNVSLSLNDGETMGLVGESGCGKSSLALSILRLIAPYEGKVTGDAILFQGQNLLDLPEKELRNIRGRDIGFVFQDPFSCLNPVIRIGKQIEEAILVHATAPELPDRTKAKVLDLLRAVRLPDPERIYDAYPHQVSGGQRQRAMIAMAISNRPKLLIADEPTTALDVTVQKEILELLASLQREMKMTILLVTHHLGIIANYTERLAVLYAGEIIEEGKTNEVIRNPQHPYTRSLLKSLPGRDRRRIADPTVAKKRLVSIPGAPPDPARLPEGCAFHPRCPVAVGDCKVKVPRLEPLVNMNRSAACHLAPFSGTL